MGKKAGTGGGSEVNRWAGTAAAEETRLPKAAHNMKAQEDTQARFTSMKYVFT